LKVKKSGMDTGELDEPGSEGHPLRVPLPGQVHGERAQQGKTIRNVRIQWLW
jgi:hypothetical protein